MINRKKRIVRSNPTLANTFCIIASIVLLAGCGKSPEEQYEQGNRYRKGEGVEKNPAEAV